MFDPKLKEALGRVQKPGRYTGGEPGSVYKDKEKVDVRFAFCFPDTYEIGMSNIGMRILYATMNQMPGVWCERVFAPWGDMEAEMRRAGIPLYALESGDPVSEFDVVAFSLGYEMAYPAVLNMLDLAGIPLRSADRPELTPLVIAGGTACSNPEPMAPFFDLMIIGEGEEVNNEVLALFRQAQQAGWSKTRFLETAAKIQGVLIPSFYVPHWNPDGTLHDLTPTHGAPARVTKRIIQDLDACYYPTDPIVPSTEIVHDRVNVELFRGCIRGCRFCQAGFIYRPIRERKMETVLNAADELIGCTGYDEVSLFSLSSGDYSHIHELVPQIIDRFSNEHVSVSLPSLRIDSFIKEDLERMQSVRKAGLTFAPEAGTQRLRDAINKGVSEDDLLRAVGDAFSSGWNGVKLYFMIGLPTETEEDILGIAELARKVSALFYSMPKEKRGKGLRLSVSASSFVPKPFTPFQWEPQDRKETLIEKQKLLKSALKGMRGVEFSYHEPDISVLEAVFARGDRKLADVLERAWELGARFDSWDEHFKLDAWNTAFEQTGVDPDAYAHRRREKDEALPWDHIDSVVTKEYLVRESERAYRAEVTKDCRLGCNGCFGEKYATYCKIN